MQRLSRRGVLRVAAALPLIGCQTGRPSDASYAACQALLDRYVAERRVSGAVLGVVREDAAPVFISSGSVALDTGQAADPHSIYRIYSMTKPIVGVATLICAAEGLLALDQPLAEIVPEFAAMRVLVDPQTMETRPAETAITIRHLLTHTAGLTYHINGDGPLQRLYREQGLFAQGRAYWPQPGDGPLQASLDDFAARLAALPLAAEPGTRWEYSVAFDLLGLVLQRAARMSFADVLAQRIFVPLGMSDTGFFVPAAKTDRLTSNYLVAEGGLQLLDDRNASPFAVAAGVDYGGSGLVSTARDYAAFCSLLLGGGVVDGRTIAPPQAVRAAGHDLLPPAVDTTAALRGADFGAGMWIMTEASARPGEEPPGSYSWGGASGTSMWIDPVNRVGVTLMTQYYPVLAYPLYSEIRQSFYRDLAAS